MDKMVQDIFHLLGIPAVWGAILTVTVLAMGAVLKLLLDHALKTQLEKIKELQRQDSFIRDLYAQEIKNFSTEQAQALRNAYLLLFEPWSSTVDRAAKDSQEQLESAIQMVMKPLRNHLGWLDELTIRKIYSVQHRLLECKGRTPEEMKREKNDLFDATETARQFVKADKIAFRLGLISQPLEQKDRAQG
jgi:hypothetical protein